MYAVCLITKCLFLFKSSKELTSVKFSKDQNSGYPMVNDVRVNPDHGRDFNPIADHDKVTKFHQG